MLVTTAKALEKRFLASDPHRGTNKIASSKFRIGMPPRTVAVPTLVIGPLPGVSVWEGVQKEASAEGHLALAQAIAAREWAEVLAGKNDIKGACEAYREALLLKYHWDGGMILRWNRMARLPPGVSDDLMLNTDANPQLLETYRSVWKESSDLRFTVVRTGNVFIITFLPVPEWGGEKLQTRISDDVMAVLKDPPGNKKP